VVTLFFRHINTGVSIQRVFGEIARFAADHIKVDSFYMPKGDASVSSMIRNLMYVYSLRRKNVINHISGDIHYALLVLPTATSIVTVHDIGFYTNQQSRMKAFGKWLLWILVLKRARRVVCISEFTKQQLMKVVSLQPSRVLVIDDPVSSEYSYQPKPFNAEKPRVLHIGTKENKNLARTIQALEGMKCHLRIVGKIGVVEGDLLKRSGLDWSNVFNVSDEEIIEEYRLCDIVTFPSLFEGFGMPIIEGQAIGRVVITSDREPMKSIAGRGAILVDPEKIDSIRDAYQSVLSDADLRENLIREGQINVKRFSVESVFSKYNEVYQELIAEKAGRE
jgi:glycosyltransferase involved in cell wall biosynthesis